MTTTEEREVNIRELNRSVENLIISYNNLVAKLKSNANATNDKFSDITCDINSIKRRLDRLENQNTTNKDDEALDMLKGMFGWKK